MRLSAGFRARISASPANRTGIGGERSGLWFEFARIIRLLRPNFVVVENVAEITNGGLGDVLASLATLGLDAEWECIPACGIGAVHERDRCWVAAYAKGESRIHKPVFGEEAKRLLDDCNFWEANPWDETNPKLCRVDDGIPDRVVRTEKLGNAVVPQITEFIGRQILKAIT